MMDDVIALIDPAVDFTVCQRLAKQLNHRVTSVREEAISNNDQQTLMTLKPAEELLCYYEVDPGNISEAELRGAYDAISHLSPKQNAIRIMR